MKIHEDEDDLDVFLEPGFGGCERISHLREMLCDFKRLGVGDLAL